MNEKELKDLKKILRKQHDDVKHSKAAAKALLVELGIITDKGNLKKAFKTAR